jgi:hypothetical protein
MPAAKGSARTPLGPKPIRFTLRNKCFCSSRGLAQAVIFVPKFVTSRREEKTRRRTDQVTYRALSSSQSQK